MQISEYRPLMAKMIQLILFIAMFASSAGASPKEVISPKSALARAHVELIGRNYDGALKRLDEIETDEHPTSQSQYLRGLCLACKALALDTSASEELSRQWLISSLSRNFPDYLKERPNNPFANDPDLLRWKPGIELFVQQNGQDVTRLLPSLNVVTDQLKRARNCALKSSSLAATPTETLASQRLLLWSDLLRYTCINAAYVQRQEMGKGGVALSKALEAARDKLPNEDAVNQVDRELQQDWLPILRECTTTKTSARALAAADTLALYSAARGRLRAGVLLKTYLKYTRLPKREPDVAAPPKSGDTGSGVADGLTVASVDASLPNAPEALILPMYNTATRLNPSSTFENGRSGLFYITLRLREAEADKMLTDWKETKGESAFISLEKARVAIRLNKDANIGVADIMDAVRAGSLRRPIFSSVPPELGTEWSRSRYLRELAPQIALDYSLLFTLLDQQIQAARVRQADVFPTLALRLRLAALLSGSNYVPDVLLGLAEGKITVAQLRQEGIPPQQLAQLSTYERQIDQTINRLPSIPSRIIVDANGVSLLNAPMDRLNPPHPPFLMVTPSMFGILK